LEDGLSDHPRTVLIGGTGRSGTNLVKNVLAAQARCAALPFESRFVTDPDGTVPTLALLRHAWSPFTGAAALQRHFALLNRVGHRSPRDRLACKVKQVGGRLGRPVRLGAYAEWELARWFPGYWQATDQLRQDLAAFVFPARWVGSASVFRRPSPRAIATDDRAGLATAAFSQFLNRIYTDFLQARGAEVYVDDNTFNLVFSDWLHRLLPQAVFVDVRRDPRDVVVSYLEQGWAPDTLQQAAAYYQAVVRRSDAATAKLPPARKVILTLDEIAAAPKAVATRISRAIDFPPDTFDFTADPVRPASLGRWKTALSAADANWLTSTLENEIDDYQALTRSSVPGFVTAT
jgi:hypothetical protein